MVRRPGTDDRGVLRRAAVAVLVGALATALPFGASSAQAPPPVVTASAAVATETQISSCEAGSPEVGRVPGSVTITRTGDLTEALEVDVNWAGALVGDPGLPPLPDPWPIPAGEASATLVLPASMRGATLALQIQENEGYAVGSPSSALFLTELVLVTPDCTSLPPEPVTPPVVTPPAPPAAPVQGAATFTG